MEYTTSNSTPGGRWLRAAAALGLTLVLGACASDKELYEGTDVASVGDLTAQNLALRDVPPPKHRHVVAVYDFPDQTGQYKERETVQSLSRAVTQAGAPLLIKALQDAGHGKWFSVLDRSNLESSVQERQIIERMRQRYTGEQNVDPDVLGPLMHAGIILTGGIVGYDTNMRTGGFGARYLGIGADAEWKYDVVTVNLRAVSTETNEVLANVLVRKPIASVRGQGDVFRFVALDELLESEGGVATNEPRQIAVQQSIEKAVMALIAEGASRGLWNFADQEAQKKFIEGYRQQLFNGEVPPGARQIAPPETRNAAHIAQTKPVARPTQIRERQQEPVPSASPPPSGVQSDEALG